MIIVYGIAQLSLLAIALLALGTWFTAALLGDCIVLVVTLFVMIVAWKTGKTLDERESAMS